MGCRARALSLALLFLSAAPHARGSAAQQPAGAPAARSKAADSSAAGLPAAGLMDEITVVGERPGPRLWKVTRGDHVLWLLGTLNHLPTSLRWRSAEVEGVIRQSQQVLASTPDVSAGLGPIGTIRLYFQWRRSEKDPDKTTLKDWVPAPLYARFELIKQRYDPHDRELEQLRPSIAALRLYEHAIAASGLTSRDEAEREVLRLAERRHVPIRHAAFRVEDPAAALREISALPPSVEVSCLETTVRRIETDLATMQERALAWSVGDVDRLRHLNFDDQREACLSALSGAPRIKALVDRAEAAWELEAQAALEMQPVSLAIAPIYILLQPDGPLAKFRAEGFTVEGP
jgi:uncharacterized protein YbaP (TraB family)